MGARSLFWPAVALTVIWGVAFSVGPTADVHINDIGVYRGYADAMRGGQYPYLDFALEYPPLSLVVFAAAGMFGTAPDTYEFVLGALMLGATLVVLALTADLAGERRLTAAWLVALSPLLTGAVARTHFDVVAVVIMLAALVALISDRPLLGFALLGVGAMVKLFPGLLVPVAAAWLIGRGRRREALRGVAVFAAVVVVISLPFLSHGYLDAYTFQFERPVQIESTPASLLFALGGSHVTGYPYAPDRFKSNGLAGGVAAPVAGAFAGLLLATLAAITVLAARRRDQRGLLLAAFAAVIAFAALGKVLSPQFMIWLVPFAALAWVWGERALAVMCGATILLTQFEFPARYADLVAQDTLPIVLVGARNLLLLAALALTLARLAAPARSSPPAAAATP